MMQIFLHVEPISDEMYLNVLPKNSIRGNKSEPKLNHFSKIIISEHLVKWNNSILILIELFAYLIEHLSSIEF